MKPKLLQGSLIKIKQELKKISSKTVVKEDLSHKDRLLIKEIYDKTSLLNSNNITRTKAYLDYYNRFPEVHWSFLAHMVSRNAGWNMTDLKGELLSRLLNRKEAAVFFNFLERGNWLIFQDVFPQLLLYEESLKYGKSLFHLLSYLNISVFMEAMWNFFLDEKDPYLLTMALVINEQSYIEERVIRNPDYKKMVVNTLQFKLQDYLSVTHIIFPYEEKDEIKLAGQTIHHFESLHERIFNGKRLYNILFAQEDRLFVMRKWANQHPHTGSRKDYWPHLFNNVMESPPGSILKPRIKGCRLFPGAERVYSPCLEFAWKDQTHSAAETGDWYKDWKVIYYMQNLDETIDGEIKHDYCKSLEILELASNTKKAISHRDE
ncbi:DUF2515 family protein [Bacillus sp. S/N-304-OC-R1]|nr:DUF2515 family protein [Bacillus sp. S/N-304-OC-R1]